MNLFLYDGNCKFCSKLANKLKSICLSKEIEFRSFREIPTKSLKTIHPTLTEEVLFANVQLIQDGSRYPGFFAIRKLSIHLRFYRYFFWVLYLPLIPFIGIMVMNYLKTRKDNGSS